MTRRFRPSIAAVLAGLVAGACSAVPPPDDVGLSSALDDRAVAHEVDAPRSASDARSLPGDVLEFAALLAEGFEGADFQVRSSIGEVLAEADVAFSATLLSVAGGRQIVAGELQATIAETVVLTVRLEEIYLGLLGKPGSVVAVETFRQHATSVDDLRKVAPLGIKLLVAAVDYTDPSENGRYSTEAVKSDDLATSGADRIWFVLPQGLVLSGNGDEILGGSAIDAKTITQMTGARTFSELVEAVRTELDSVVVG